MSPWADEPHTATWPTRPWFKSIGAVLVPLIIFVAFPLTGCRGSAAPARDPRAALQESLAKTSVQKTSPAEKLEKALSGIEGALARARAKVRARKNASKDLKALAGFAADIGRIDSEVKAEFSRTREVLAKIKAADKDAIQAKVEKEYAAKMRHLKGALTSITEPSPGSATATREGRLSAMTALSSWVDSMTPEPPHQPLGSELPHRIVDYKAGPPTLGTAIAPAYAPNTPGAVPSTLPVAPTAEDLTQTVEVQFTEDISATANELGRDPVKLYEFVRNTMDYEPYYGSRKGANETLWEKAGNDFDQASLLIALYRYSGIPARYVYGVVEIPIERAMNWVGVEVPEAAAKLLSAAGVPVKAITSRGKITKLQLEHCWVEAYVPYESYRGVAAGAGAAKKQWVALDPSWKRYTRTEPMDLRTLVPFDAEGLLSTMQAIGAIDVTGGLVAGIDATRVTDALASYAGELESYLDSREESSTVGDVIGTRRIERRQPGLLPPTIALRTASVTQEAASVAGRVRSRVRFETDGLTWEALLSELASRRLTFRYAPATDEDSATIAEYGGVYETPCYLVKMRPTVDLDGRAVATGAPIGLGQTQTLSQTFLGAGPDHVVDNIVTAGEAFGLLIHPGHVSRELLEGARNGLEVPVDRMMRGVEAWQPRADELLGRAMQMSLLSYVIEADAYEEVIAGIGGVRHVRSGPVAGRSGIGVSVRTLFGSASACGPASPYIDMDQMPSVATAKDGDSAKAVRFGLQTGMLASELEAALLERVYHLRADSATSLMRRAMQRGTPVRVVTAQNAPSVLPQLNIDEAVVTDVRGAVAAGFTVVVPEEPERDGDWEGVGYMVLDERTGSGGYMVSGGLAGGVGHEALGCLSELIQLVAAWSAMSYANELYGYFGACSDIYLHQDQVTEMETKIQLACATASFAIGMVMVNLTLWAASALSPSALAAAIVTSVVLGTLMLVATNFAAHYSDSGTLGDKLGRAVLDLLDDCGKLFQRFLDAVCGP